MARKLFVSFKGTAVYPHLVKPDTKFDKDGVYSVKLRGTGPDAEALAKQIDEAIAASVEQAKETIQKSNLSEKDKAKRLKKLAPTPDLPYSRDEDDGSITFNFKMKAKGKTKEGEEFTRRPALFDGTGAPLSAPKIGGGSTIRVSFEIAPFYTVKVGAGVSLRLAAVQIIKLVEYDADASRFGFAAEEPEETDTDTESEETEDADEDEDEDAEEEEF